MLICRFSPNLRSCFPYIAVRGGGDTSFKQGFPCAALGRLRWLLIAVFTTAAATNKSAVNMMANCGHVMSVPTVPARQGWAAAAAATAILKIDTMEYSSSYPKTAYRIVIPQACCPAGAGAPSFLRNSCSRLQVQTVPSSAWDAPCPVVTPSHQGLARRFLLFSL